MAGGTAAKPGGLWAQAGSGFRQKQPCSAKWHCREEGLEVCLSHPAVCPVGFWEQAAQAVVGSAAPYTHVAALCPTG